MSQGHNVFRLFQYLITGWTWANMRTTLPPTSGTQNGCHGNVGCLATGTHFMAAWFKNGNVYKH